MIQEAKRELSKELSICSFDEYAEKHRENRKTHPTFGEHRWDEWKNASKEERAAMKEKLKDTFGYL